MAVSIPPTVRPSGGPVDTAAATNRVMRSPIRDTSADRSAARRRCCRAGWMLALSIVVLLLVGVLAVSASAQPATPTPADPCSGPEPPPIPCASAPTPTQPTSPAPTTAGQPTTTPSTPCTGEHCIPQPTTPRPSTGPQQPGTGGGEGGPDCGITDVEACITEAINSMFRSLVEAALSPILELLGHTALSTPTIDSLPGIGELWNNSWELAVAAYGLLILVGGIVVMSHESIQTRYSIKEIGPRIPIAFIASALSLFVVDKLIRLANALTLGVLGDGLNAPSLGTTLNNALQGILTGGLFIILVGLVLVILGLGLLIVHMVCVAITMILIISGPLFVIFHATPQTDPLACWWWKAIFATLAIPVAQALVLTTAVNTFLTSGVHLFGSTLSALGTLIAAIALFFILFKIPFWLLSSIRVGSRRSFLGGLVRTYIAATAFGMVAGKAGAFGRAGTASADRGTKSSGRGGPSTGAADPRWPAQPRIAPTPEMVNKRLTQAYDAERARAARRSRLPSQAPRFLQPQPQQTTHDPAVTPATPGPTMPEFSSAPRRDTPVAPSSRRGPRPGSAPQFQAATTPRRRGATAPPARPIRVASVPPHLQFRPATAEPPQPSRPVKPASTAPAAPVFRQAQPEPRIGDAYRRTQSVPPPVFRAPTPTRGDEGT